MFKNIFNLQSKGSPTTPVVSKQKVDEKSHERTSSETSFDEKSPPSSVPASLKEESKLSSSPTTTSIPIESEPDGDKQRGASPTSTSPPTTTNTKKDKSKKKKEDKKDKNKTKSSKELKKQEEQSKQEEKIREIEEEEGDEDGIIDDDDAFMMPSPSLQFWKKEDDDLDLNDWSYFASADVVDKTTKRKSKAVNNRQSLRRKSENLEEDQQEETLNNVLGDNNPDWLDDEDEDGDYEDYEDEQTNFDKQNQILEDGLDEEQKKVFQEFRRKEFNEVVDMPTFMEPNMNFSLYTERKQMESLFQFSEDYDLQSKLNELTAKEKNWKEKQFYACAAENDAIAIASVNHSQFIVYYIDRYFRNYNLGMKQEHLVRKFVFPKSVLPNTHPLDVIYNSTYIPSVRIFMAPIGIHMLVCVEDQVFYMNSFQKSSQPFKISDLCGSKITAVAWDPKLMTMMESIKKINPYKPPHINERQKWTDFQEKFRFIESTGRCIVAMNDLKIKLIELHLPLLAKTEKLDIKETIDLIDCSDPIKKWKKRREKEVQHKLDETDGNYHVIALEWIKYHSQVAFLVVTPICILYYGSNTNANDIKAVMDEYKNPENPKLVAQYFVPPISTAIHSTSYFKLIVNSEFKRTRFSYRKTSNVPSGFVWKTANEGQVFFGQFFMKPNQMLVPENFYLLPVINKDEDIMGIACTDFYIWLLVKSNKKPARLDVYLQPPDLSHFTKDFTMISRQIYSKTFDSGEQVVNLTQNTITKMDMTEFYILCQGTTSIYKIAMDFDKQSLYKLYMMEAIHYPLKELEEDAIKSEMEFIETCFEKAYFLAPDSIANNLVQQEKGDFYFKMKKLEEAARAYSRSNRNVEDISLQLMQADPLYKTNSLLIYLKGMLERAKAPLPTETEEEQKNKDLLLEEEEEDTYNKKNKEDNNQDAMDRNNTVIALCVWIIEIFISKLDNMTCALYETISLDDASSNLQKQQESIAQKETIYKQRKQTRIAFRKFLKSNAPILKPYKQVVYKQLLQNGLEQDLQYFAVCIEDFEKVISWCIINQEYGNAVQILTQKCVEKEDQQELQEDQELKEQIWIKFSPLLLKSETKQRETLIQAFKTNFWDPNKLIPALVAYLQSTLAAKAKSQPKNMRQSKRFTTSFALNETQNSSAVTIPESSKNSPFVLAQFQQFIPPNHPVVEYLKWSIENQLASPAIYNWYINLLARHQRPEAMNEFLKIQLENGDVPFSKEYALRVCSKNAKKEACIQLYASMGLFEKAVDMALLIGKDEIAKEIINSVTDKELKKQLLVKIIRFAVLLDRQGGQTYGRKDALQLVEKYEDVLRLSDVLREFSDDTILEDFTKQIEACLSAYARETENLNREMQNSFTDAVLIKETLHANKQVVDVTVRDNCEECQRSLLRANAGADLYVFHCGHTFHEGCLSSLVIAYLNRVCFMLERKESLFTLETDYYFDELESQLGEEQLTVEEAKNQIRLIQNLTTQASQLRDKLKENPFNRSDLEKRLLFVTQDLSDLIGKQCPLDSKPIIDTCKYRIITENAKQEWKAWNIHSSKK